MTTRRSFFHSLAAVIGAGPFIAPGRANAAHPGPPRPAPGPWATVRLVDEDGVPITFTHGRTLTVRCEVVTSAVPPAIKIPSLDFGYPLRDCLACGFEAIFNEHEPERGAWSLRNGETLIRDGFRSGPQFMRRCDSVELELENVVTWRTR